jgi:hypothetical protein
MYEPVTGIMYRKFSRARKFAGYAFCIKIPQINEDRSGTSKCLCLSVQGVF